MIPKIVFSLVFIGGGDRSTYLAYFTIHEMDERFRCAPSFLAANGWSVRSSQTPDIQIENRRIYLRGIAHADDHRQNLITIFNSTEEAARAKLQEIVDAIKNWAEHCPAISDTASLTACSPEVRESLLAANLSQDEEEEIDAPAPVYYDEFIPPKIALG